MYQPPTEGATAQGVFWLVLNIASAVAIILATKSVFKTLDLSIPISLTAINFVTIYLMLCLAAHAGVFERRQFPAKRTNLRVLMTICMSCAPLVSNLSLLWNTTAVYQLCKTLQTPVTVCLESVLQGKSVSVVRASALASVCVGILIATVMDFRVGLISGHGLLAACGAIATTTCNKVLQAKLQQGDSQQVEKPEGNSGESSWGAMQLMHALMPSVIPIQLAFAVLVERRQIMEGLIPAPFSVHMLIQATGLLAFGVNYTQFKSVGVTSALTHTLSGQFKTASVILGGVVLFGARSSSQQLLGAAVAMASLVGYAHLTLVEKATEANARPVGLA